MELIKYKYLQDKDFLKDLDESQVKRLFIKIILLDWNEKKIDEIQGQIAPGGALNVDSSSAIRRTLDLSFFPFPDQENIYKAENLISLNKKIKIEIGLQNFSNQYQEFPILWFPQGVFVIVNANRSEDSSSSVISLSLQDKGCLLDGSIGGTLSSAINLASTVIEKKVELNSENFIKDYTIIKDEQGNIISTTFSNYGIKFDINTILTEEDFLLSSDDTVTLTYIDDNLTTVTQTVQYSFLGIENRENFQVVKFLIQEVGTENTLMIEPSFSLTYSFTRKTLIFDIIKELVEKIGGENPSKIIINDLPAVQRTLVKWDNQKPLYLYHQDNKDILSLKEPTTTSPIKTFSQNEIVGYTYSYFYYPDSDFVLDKGSSVIDGLNKLIEILGNYEYFYDVYGNFIFQEKKNYINSSFTSEKWNYFQQTNLAKTVYDFSNKKLINKISNIADYSKIKNDFVVWGKRQVNGVDVPIRFHLAIDSKPQDESGTDFRQILYNKNKESEKLNLPTDIYWAELKEEWSDVLLDTDNLKDWTYYLDFIDIDSDIQEISIQNIGRRNIVISDDTISSLFPVEPNNYLIETEIFEKNPNQKLIFDSYANSMGYSYSVGSTINAAPILRIPDDEREIEQSFLIGATSEKDAYTVIKQQLYEKTNYNKNITLVTVPIYYIDVNNLISILDNNAGITGNYLIKSFTIPFGVDEQMTIQTETVIENNY